MVHDVDERKDITEVANIHN